ncbi:hypothetical protein LZ30DRAFT_463190 [Colletotrichum cereale]|nr:hypothetical protein LZ30DRAFT_463190 [Colletotrichum cereale]
MKHVYKRAVAYSRAVVFSQPEEVVVKVHGLPCLSLRDVGSVRSRPSVLPQETVTNRAPTPASAPLPLCTPWWRPTARLLENAQHHSSQ